MKRTMAWLLAGVMISGCGDPLADFATPADVDLAPEEPTTAIVEAPSERQPSLLGRLLGNREAPAEPSPVAPDEGAIEAAVAEAEEITTIASPAEEESQIPAVSTDETEPETLDVAAAPEAVAQPRRAGLLGLFTGRGLLNRPNPEQPQGETSETAVAAPAPRPGTGPDLATVAPGEPVPFGQIATACAMRRANLGTQIDSQAGFALYDSSPGSIQPRAHYITGFRDGCPRQFTAALALMGDPQGYELVEQARAHSSSNTVDTAFDGIRSSVCRVSAGSPCGRRINRLARNTRFVTAYASTAPSSRWADILLHNRRVAAIDTRAP